MLRPLWQGICCVRKQHYILRVSIGAGLAQAYGFSCVVKKVNHDGARGILFPRPKGGGQSFIAPRKRLTHSLF